MQGFGVETKKARACSRAFLFPVKLEALAETGTMTCFEFSSTF
jgi:hypothetical protein